MYRILLDYGIEGMKWYTGEGNTSKIYNTVNDAVQAAINNSHGTPWQIVTVIYWNAEPK